MHRTGSERGRSPSTVEGCATPATSSRSCIPRSSRHRPSVVGATHLSLWPPPATTCRCDAGGPLQRRLRRGRDRPMGASGASERNVSVYAPEAAILDEHVSDALAGFRGLYHFAR
jgi:hypothetical protein